MLDEKTSSDSCEVGLTTALAGAEWLIYRRPDDFVPSVKLSRLVAMEAKDYDKWATTTGKDERHRFPVLARELTQEQAVTMVELTKEREDG